MNIQIIQLLQNQNGILRTNDTSHILLNKLTIGIDMMPGIGIGIGTKVPVDQLS